MFSEVYGSVKQQVALTGTNTIVVLGDCTVVKLVPLIIEGTSAVRCIMTTAKVSNVIGYGKETIPSGEATSGVGECNAESQAN